MKLSSRMSAHHCWGRIHIAHTYVCACVCVYVIIHTHINDVIQRNVGATTSGVEFILLLRPWYVLECKIWRIVFVDLPLEGKRN